MCRGRSRNGRELLDRRLTGCWKNESVKILLVEDEPDLAESLAEGLQAEGYQTAVVHDGRDALDYVAANDINMMVLDRNLPGMSGDAVCRVLRSQGINTPILMLTAASTVNDRVAGLDLGADDYLTKPFAYVELLARLRALERRSRGSGQTVLEWGDVRMDLVRRVVERNGVALGLTPKEYGVLELLLNAQGGFIEVEELLDEVWGSADYHSRGIVKSAVYTLRKKLGEPSLIQAVNGRGYRLEGVADA